MTSNLEAYRNLAVEKGYLRYPRYDLIVTPSFTSNGCSIIKFGTFVRIKDKLVYVEDKFQHYPELNIMDSLLMLEKRFNERCELVMDNYILDKDNYVNEPYGE